MEGTTFIYVRHPDRYFLNKIWTVNKLSIGTRGDMMVDTSWKVRTGTQNPLQPCKMYGLLKGLEYELEQGYIEILYPWW